MSDSDELLRAILAAPEEDAPRLAYADWLTQQGDPFGDFIRVQCRLARTEPRRCRNLPLPRRSRGFLAHGNESWLVLPAIRPIRLRASIKMKECVAGG
jgi:uncharacterized protein (TIGR02996 family)